MKTIRRMVLGLFAVLLIMPAPDATAQFGRARGRDQQTNERDRVCVYQDIQYRGWEQCYNAGDELPNLNNRKDAISSIRIFGRARITVFDEEDFDGRSADFSSNVPDLGLRNLSGSRSWSDRIESIRISSDSYDRNAGQNRGQGRGRGLGRADSGNSEDGICVYEHANFQGRSQCFGAGEQIQDLSRQGNMSDRISSIQVFGRSMAVLYRDVQFQGESVTIEQDIADLGSFRGRNFGSWNDQISSLEINSGRIRFRSGR
jgi:hypothetical protein